MLDILHEFLGHGIINAAGIGRGQVIQHEQEEYLAQKLERHIFDQLGGRNLVRLRSE